MQSNWAAENLQVIRTLMERSALYRRALAPIMLTVGVIGSIAGLAGYFLKINSVQGFVVFWLVMSAVALITSFVLVRRQALKDGELFWSPPTRRVAHALAPPLIVGLLLAVLTLVSVRGKFLWPLQPWALPAIWMILYGCALHSAGFFMARGIRLLGWLFVVGGVISLSGKEIMQGDHLIAKGHLGMAMVFGGLHFAYGIYLYFTERKTIAA